MKTGVEINEIDKKNQGNQTLGLWKDQQNWQTLAELTMKIKNNPLITRIRNERRNIITNFTEIKWIKKEDWTIVHKSIR